MVQLVLEHCECSIHRHSVKCRTINNPALRSTGFFSWFLFWRSWFRALDLGGTWKQARIAIFISIETHDPCCWRRRWSECRKRNGISEHCSKLDHRYNDHLALVGSQPQTLVTEPARFTNRNTQHTKHSSLLKTSISDWHMHITVNNFNYCNRPVRMEQRVLHFSSTLVG